MLRNRVASSCLVVLCLFGFAPDGVLSGATAQDDIADVKQDESTATKAAAVSQAAEKAQGAPGKARKKGQKRPSTQERLQAIEGKLDALANQLETLTQESSDTTDETATTESSDRRPSAPEMKLPPALQLESDWLENVPWRSVGPANMGGRVTDLVVHDQDPTLWWIATASGGMLKTTNKGITVEHQFDHENTVSIGAIAADPNNKEVVWVGTGEANPRNSVSYGDGVYKSVDGGKSWKHMGLKETYQVGRILVSPKDGKTVYVGALGRLYGSNRERGVFKTTDGGETWEHVLYVDDNTGVIDMIMHPENPDVIIAALWDRERDGFDSWPGSVEKPEGIDGYDPIRKWGPGAGLYKTSDGGKNWKKLSAGLPEGMTGRIGLDWQTKSPHTIYAIIDCEDIGKGPQPFAAYLGIVGTDVKKNATITQLMPESPAEKAGVQVGDVITKIDGQDVKEFDQLLEALRKKKPGNRISLALRRGDEDVSIATKVTGRPGTSQSSPQIWIGAAGEDIDGGIKLTQVTANGPAAKAGLKKDDVITKVGDAAPENFEKLVANVREMAADDKLKVTAKRGEEVVEVEVTLDVRPTRGTQQRSSAYMGIQGQDAEGGGAALTTVTEGGPSAKAGLKAGDVVIKIGEEKAADYAALIAGIRSRQAGDKMKLTVRRGDKTVNLVVTLGDRNAGTSSRTRPYTWSYFGQRANIQDQQGAKGHNYGGIYKSTDAGETWKRVNSLNTRPMYFSVIRVDPSDDKRVYVLGVSQFRSSDGGRTFTSDFGRGVHSDAHDLWIDPNDGRCMVIGCDGGFYVTNDRGSRWDHINTAAIGQFYHVAISPRKPYWVAGGLQDNGSWAGPAISRSGGSVNEDWVSVGGGDGFVCRVDPNDPDLIYYESQNGSMGRRNLRTGERASIRPRRVRGVTYRFNWQTPFILSNHNSRIFLCAGNYVFRSLDRGNNLQRISPEITLTQRGSATALAESPVDPNVIYVGTDDGALWVTRNGGSDWTNITENLGAPAPRWVSSIEPSRYAAGRVYVALDGHRSDDDNPYAFVSYDHGQTFVPLHKGLPRGSTRCLREDTKNQNLLYLGTEFGFYVSIDRGQNWARFNQQLPTVAVHEVAVHPANGEIVLATHGRSLWACDVSGLRAINSEKFASEIAFYQPSDVIRWRSAPRRGRTNRRYVSQNPASGAQFWYSLPKKAGRVVVQVDDVEGRQVSRQNGSSDPGLHRVTWNMTRTAQRGGRGGAVPSGTYKVTLLVDNKAISSHTVTLQSDPSLAADAVADEVYEDMLAEEAMREDQEEAAEAAGVDLDELEY